MPIRGSNRHAAGRCSVRICVGNSSLTWRTNNKDSRKTALANYQKQAFSNDTLIAIEAALQAGDILRQGYGTVFEVSQKEGQHNLVTEYDYKAEKSIISFLKSHVPNSQFLAEESGFTGESSDNLWVIDPLDGTVNFAHHIPIFAVSIALEKRGSLFCGVIYQPITHELFVAEKGKGAFLNGKTIRVSTVKKFSDAMVYTGFPYNLKDNPFHCIDHFIDILRVGIPIRRMGSAAIDLAYTSAGRCEGFFEVGLSPWDCAAGVLMLEEAGGKISTWDRQPFYYRRQDPILCSNGHIHDALADVLNRPV